MPRPAPNGDRRPLGVINAAEVYPLREAARRLGWARKTTTRAEKEGLVVVQFGRTKYVTGLALLKFFRRLEEQ